MRITTDVTKWPLIVEKLTKHFQTYEHESNIQLYVDLKIIDTRKFLHSHLNTIERHINNITYISYLQRLYDFAVLTGFNEAI